MFFESKIDDQTWLLLEAETTGAFAKSGLEGSKMSPELAFQNLCTVSAQVARGLSQMFDEKLAGTNTEVDVTFGVKSDAGGNVMVCFKPGEGQLSVTVRYTAR